MDQQPGSGQVGHGDAEIAKVHRHCRPCPFHRMRVQELNQLDLSYTPPFGSPGTPSR